MFFLFKFVISIMTSAYLFLSDCCSWISYDILLSSHWVCNTISTECHT